MTTSTTILFPGRHHALTRYQVDYLHALLRGEVRDTDGTPIVCAPDAVIVFAVTSANHSGTRRNPLPGHRREALIERVTTVENLPGVVVHIPDVPTHDRFAELVVTTVATDTRDTVALTPDRCVVACSTPTVADDYRKLGYRIAGVELDHTPTAARPWDCVEALAAGNPVWARTAHPQTVDFYRRYGYTHAIPAIFADPVATDEGDLTATRDYRTYAAAFENASDRKWTQVGPHLQTGRVLDIGCATGGLLEKVAADPRHRESDLFGVDIARPLLEEAEHKKRSGVFANPNIWFVRANLLTTDVMDPASVDTTVTIALTHEIYSYGNGRQDLATFTRRIHTHTRPGGVWVNSDVLGPADPDRIVALTLTDTDGKPLEAARTDLDTLTREQVAEFIGSLSTAAKFTQFAHDFPRLSGSTWGTGMTRRACPVPGDGTAVTWVLRLADAMEFMTTKDYADNWLSECHEQFGGMTYAGWVTLLEETGFEVDAVSAPTRNEWLVQHRFAPVAQLADPGTGDTVPWPDTHVLTVARRPLV